MQRQAYWGIAKYLLVEAIHLIHTDVPLTWLQFEQKALPVHPFWTQLPSAIEEYPGRHEHVWCPAESYPKILLLELEQLEQVSGPLHWAHWLLHREQTTELFLRICW
mgnify:CR=1 FL=1